MPNSVAEPRQCRMPRDCDLRHVKSMSEKLIASHYENNYGGSVKYLNLNAEQPT